MNIGMTRAKLDWSTGRVEDSDLTVALARHVSKAWRGRFENTVRLLGRGDWGDVRLRTGRVRVSDVTPGGEEKLRHRGAQHRLLHCRSAWPSPNPRPSVLAGSHLLSRSMKTCAMNQRHFSSHELPATLGVGKGPRRGSSSECGSTAVHGW
jgi:hypothetical protein